MTHPMITWAEDAGVVTVTLDDPTRAVNTVGDAYAAAMDDVLDRLAGMREQLTGVVLTSGKPTFLAGGDLAPSARRRAR